MIYQYSSHIRDNAERAARVIIGVKGVEIAGAPSASSFHPCHFTMQLVRVEMMDSIVKGLSPAAGPWAACWLVVGAMGLSVLHPGCTA